MKLRHRVLAGATCIVGVGLAYPLDARAGVPTRLVYVRDRATSSCPPQEELEAAVAARLGYEPFSPWGDQTIVATISLHDRRLVARAELIDHDGIQQGFREVSASPEHCDELIATLALAISITLDPMRVEAPSSPEPAAPEPKPTSEATGEPDAAHDDTAPPAEALPPAALGPPTPVANATREIDRRLSLRAQVGVVTHAGNVPQFAVGGRAGVGAELARFSIWFEGQASLPTSESVADGGEVRISLRAGLLAPCVRVAGPMTACVVGALGSFRGTGSGVPAPRTESAPYAAVGARAVVSIPLGRVFSFVGQAELIAMLSRPTFQLHHADVWRPAPVSPSAGIALAARFF
jgi:hypothetical protein